MLIVSRYYTKISDISGEIIPESSLMLHNLNKLRSLVVCKGMMFKGENKEQNAWVISTMRRKFQSTEDTSVIGAFHTKERACEVLEEIIFAFGNGDRIYRVPND